MKFTTKRRVNFYDCDPAGIMFFGNAFFFIHSAYEEMISSWGLKNYWTSSEFFVPITKAESDFFSPVKPGSFIIIEVYVKQLKKRSFELQYVGFDEEGKKLFASRTVHVFIDRNFNKIPVPENIKIKLREYSESV